MNAQPVPTRAADREPRWGGCRGLVLGVLGVLVMPVMAAAACYLVLIHLHPR